MVCQTSIVYYYNSIWSCLVSRLYPVLSPALNVFPLLAYTSYWCNIGLNNALRMYYFCRILGFSVSFLFFSPTFSFPLPYFSLLLFSLSPLSFPFPLLLTFLFGFENLNILVYRNTVFFTWSEFILFLFYVTIYIFLVFHKINAIYYFKYFGDSFVMTQCNFGFMTVQEHFFSKRNCELKLESRYLLHKSDL